MMKKHETQNKHRSQRADIENNPLFHNKRTIMPSHTDSRERRRLVILDDSSSGSELSLNESVISIDSSNDGDEVGASSNGIVDLVATMEKVTIEPDSNKETIKKRCLSRGNIDSLDFESDSDGSCTELFQRAFRSGPKKISLDDSSSSSSCSDHDKRPERSDNHGNKGRHPTKSSAKATAKETSRPATGLSESWVLDRDRNEFVFSSSSSTPMPKFRIPAKLYEQLFEHQQSGVSWMAGLHCQKVGGLLGDDMGMGKTFVALTYLGGLMRARTIRNALIVAPLSVLRSWETEALKIVKQCVPNIKIIIVASTMGKATRCRHLQAALECSGRSPCIVITTYGLVGSSPLDFVHNEFAWDYVILDEGHTIKNPTTKVSQGCRRIARDPRTHRMILTGTPIMNNLKELWAVLDFATSGKVLGKLKSFKNRYSSPIEDARSADATGHVIRIGEKANLELQQKIKPYFLQRLKIDFLADKLPKKQDFVVWTHLSKYQRAMYSRYVNSGDSAVAQVLSGISTSPLEAVTWLKKLCGHPVLLEKDNSFATISSDELKKNSSKLQVLDTLVERLRNQGHRTLIFSQSTKMLDIIEKVLSGVRLSRIDGSTKERDRQRRVDDFNNGNGDIEVMLLSTKAAGVGLTLTGADRAIIYDPSWNPAEDSQAVDRCYRIGQRKEVVVFRFITAGSVEEKMYEKQVHKDGIRRAVMTSMGNNTMRYFDKDSLRKLFTLGEEGVCEFLERLKLQGLASSDDSPEARLTSHKGAMGVSSHDRLYASGNLIDITNGAMNTKTSGTKGQSNPFSLASPPPRIGSAGRLDRQSYNNSPEGNDEKFQPKVMGRSQRVLSRQGSAQSATSSEEAGANEKENELPSSYSTPINPNKKIPLTLAPNEDVTNTFQQVNQERESGNHACALELLMNLLENRYHGLQKDDKMEVHKRIALIAYELQWL